MDKNFYKENLVISGVGNVVYTDLYKGLKYSKFYGEIPDDILKLFVKKFIQQKVALEKKTDMHIDELIPFLIDNIDISSQDVIFEDSMFSDETKMYSYMN